RVPAAVHRGPLVGVGAAQPTSAAHREPADDGARGDDHPGAVAAGLFRADLWAPFASAARPAALRQAAGAVRPSAGWSARAAPGRAARPGLRRRSTLAECLP